MLQRLRKILAKVAETPLHPQWFALRREQRSLKAICAELSGIVLDVGCASGKPRAHLKTQATYVGLDYYDTAKLWYQTRPDLFGDARKLPLTDCCINHVLLLDVLEHVSHPDQCLHELYRCLIPGGTVTIQVPFMYPIHDAPLDFHRWSASGLSEAAQKHGFTVRSSRALGHPLETAALLANIALAKSVMNWARHKNPLCLLGIFLPLVIPAVNVMGWLLARVSSADDMMPHAYQTVWEKPAAAPVERDNAI